MHCNCRNIPNGFHIPDFTEQLLLGKDMVRIFRQKCQQIKFFGCKLFFFVVNPYAARGFVYFNATDFYDIIFLLAAANQALAERGVRFSSVRISEDRIAFSL